MGQREEAIRSAVAGSSGVPLAAVRLVHRQPQTFQSNRLYDAWVEGNGPDGARHLIVKEFLKPDEFEDAPLREHRALQLLAPMDVAPQPLSHHPPTPFRRPLVIYEYMEGKMWNRRRPSPEELQQLASLWLDVNRVTGEGRFVFSLDRLRPAISVQSFAPALHAGATRRRPVNEAFDAFQAG